MGLLIVNVAVSVPSAKASSTMVKVVLPVVCPLGMVMLVLARL
ncbi:hypothetical protein QT989_31995 [Microcoleus sp. SVA1_B6]